MTAATPIRTPSMVRSERSQFELMPRRAMITFPQMPSLSAVLGTMRPGGRLTRMGHMLAVGVDRLLVVVLGELMPSRRRTTRVA